MAPTVSPRGRARTPAAKGQSRRGNRALAEGPRGDAPVAYSLSRPRSQTRGGPRRVCHELQPPRGWQTCKPTQRVHIRGDTLSSGPNYKQRPVTLLRGSDTKRAGAKGCAGRTEAAPLSRAEPGAAPPLHRVPAGPRNVSPSRQRCRRLSHCPQRSVAFPFQFFNDSSRTTGRNPSSPPRGG